MAITNNDQLVAALASKLTLVPYAPQTTPTTTAGRMISLWTVGGMFGGVGATPATGAGAACDNTTDGGVPLPTVAGGDTLYLLPLQLAAGAACALYVIDRLVATSGLSANTTASQTVNSAALPARGGTGVGVGVALEFYVIGGTNPPASVTITYTNSAGVSGRTATTPITAAVNILRLFIPLMLQAGDVGVQSVQSVQLNTASGAAGNVGVTLFRWLAREGLVSAAGGQTGQSIYDQGLPVVDTTACLQMLLLPPTAIFPNIFGAIPFVSG